MFGYGGKLVYKFTSEEGQKKKDGAMFFKRTARNTAKGKATAKAAGRAKATGKATARAKAQASPQAAAGGKAEPVSLVAALKHSRNEPEGEVAIFAAGCFWGVQQKFDQVSGVLASEVGYIGGELDRPTYREVCEGDTGHAEAVRLVFDPQQTNYRTLLRHFFALHDPTQLNRQGPDTGRQYRSAIFHTSQDQRHAAEEFISASEASGRFAKPIVTEIIAAPTWWRAEAYHQKYFAKQKQAHQPDFEIGSLRQSQTKG